MEPCLYLHDKHCVCNLKKIYANNIDATKTSEHLDTSK